ncbi:MAG: class I SAM-dependent methyltransferase, partial [Eubacterium sp.]|nr:class I SAM-dependent methyltransferase [Eubacterium sp.]
MTEHEWDKLLKIRTSGRDDSHADQYRFPYEPTPYPVLERLAGSGYITKKNTLIDYGCGKGRVGFYLSWQVRCRSIGIEYDDRIFQAALKNQESAVSGRRVKFHKNRAELYSIPEDADRLYFFNPFSVEVLRKVMGRIRETWYACPREILLFFYYPAEEYVGYLMTVDELTFLDEIDCIDLFEGRNKRERILVFRME